MVIEVRAEDGNEGEGEATEPLQTLRSHVTSIELLPPRFGNIPPRFLTMADYDLPLDHDKDDCSDDLDPMVPEEAAIDMWTDIQQLCQTHTNSLDPSTSLPAALRQARNGDCTLLHILKKLPMSGPWTAIRGESVTAQFSTNQPRQSFVLFADFPQMLLTLSTRRVAEQPLRVSRKGITTDIVLELMVLVQYRATTALSYSTPDAGRTPARGTARKSKGCLAIDTGFIQNVHVAAKMRAIVKDTASSTSRRLRSRLHDNLREVRYPSPNPLEPPALDIEEKSKEEVIYTLYFDASQKRFSLTIAPKS
ncbi:uncharacterized protein BKA55DRAFT_740532 [Fusarium redolens]|uniref:Uncharacterized protein n=1 Tax=Fusarium redolens TaxID=48865 RepID=A0A9P9GQM2_FUSRE|nr:uncharacterized protein BKA55DRAFT_740532 [Fusarium redolens]KAH7243715.1 hypothetical protein BKA55DRAFT_740532 [Fusarium redolens]